MLLFTFIVVLCVFAFAASTGLRGTCSVADLDKTDCGYMGITQSGCEAKGCCWASSTGSNVPWCFYQSGYTPTSCFKYQVISKIHFEFFSFHSFFPTPNLKINRVVWVNHSVLLKLLLCVDFSCKTSTSMARVVSSLLLITTLQVVHTTTTGCVTVLWPCVASKRLTLVLSLTLRPPLSLTSNGLSTTRTKLILMVLMSALNQSSCYQMVKSSPLDGADHKMTVLAWGKPIFDS